MNSVTEALDLLIIEAKKIDPTNSKFGDNKELLKIVANLDIRSTHFNSTLLAISQANPLVPQELLAIGNHLQEDIITMTNNIKSSDTIVGYNDWVKVMAELGSIKNILSSEEQNT